MAFDKNFDLVIEEISILNKIFDNKDDVNGIKKSGLTIKNKDKHLKKLLDLGLISESKEGRATFYKITENGKEYYTNNRNELLTKLSSRASKAPKPKKAAGNDLILQRLDIIEKKLDELFAILNTSPGRTIEVKSIPNKPNSDLMMFEAALKEEYKKLKERDFLGDGSVWHQELKKIIMERYRYQDYEYDEMLQSLIRSKIGMIVLSQGREKTWIEIKE
ncbi:hypothetical protein CUJ83_00825 [Methanocella sp. CWC-04]|uniref:Winged helix DNA-binding domain-containing protein n=1 Tax=Methanooceanicella nereidis TaxID=2052831 RepID=A0AAP2R9T3_9EURY|nr:hypothetical protein [Methanocella sp. CWC-04]MCD1293539.1 hypothetical protein [Methanocella sp. CWC-04]